jgi:hypothetical protein
MKTRLNTRWVGYTAALAGALAMGGIAQAKHKGPQEDNGWGGHDRPVYAFLSLTAEGFEIEQDVGNITGKILKCACEYGSPMLMVQIGSYRAGDSIETTRFEGAGPVPLPELPEPGTVDPDSGWTYDDLDFNQLTILGSFATDTATPVIHMMTPYQGEIDAAAQEAFFNASPYLAEFLAGVDAEGRFPTTFEAALFVHQNQGAAGATLDQIQQAMFATGGETPREVTPELIQGALTVADEGTLFPHDPFANGLFRYEFVLNVDDGTLTSESLLPIVIDIKPGNSNNSVNLGSEGVLPIAAITTATFDAENELDPSTVTAVLLDDRGRELSYGQVPALRWEYVDLDDDNDLDILFKFDTAELAEVAARIPAAEWTAVIHFRGETTATVPMGVLASDTVRVVPPKN